MRPHNSGHWSVRTAPSRASSSSTCAPCSTCRSATPSPRRGVVRHGEHPGRTRREDRSTSASPRPWPSTRGAKIHTARQGSRAPAARSATSPSSGDDLDEVAYRRAGDAAGVVLPLLGLTQRARRGPAPRIRRPSGPDRHRGPRACRRAAPLRGSSSLAALPLTGDSAPRAAPAPLLEAPLVGVVMGSDSTGAS